MRKSYLPLLVLTVLAFAMGGCQSKLSPTPTPVPSTSPPSAAREARPIIIDTDMAADDWMAILYLLQRPDASVQAITVTGTGEAHCGPGTRNALGLLALAGNVDVPVACGREVPLEGNHTFPTAWRENVDSLMGLSLPQNPDSPSRQTAVELLILVIRTAPESVVLVTLGPLTNVAEALQKEPTLVEKLEMIYVMGGAVDVPGNLQVPGVQMENRVSEWNIYVDPHAAAVVFESGAPITLVALDATKDAPITMAFYERLEADRAVPEADFVYQTLARMEGLIESGGYFFWDPLAAAVATDESIVTIENRKLQVIEEEGPQSGRTVAAEGGNSIRVCTAADRARFEALFVETLNGRVR